MLELPHTAGCFVCGRDNAHGLHLSLQVEPSTGIIHTTFTPLAQHIGFQGLIHGGILATVADEAMVWAAIWSSRRSCVAGELNMRYKRKATIGQPLIVRAKIKQARPRLIETECDLTTNDGNIIASATGKYVPLSAEDTAAFLRTLMDDPATTAAAKELRQAS
jgi:uncharacterized protein (TIGR00369 family)